MKNSKFIVLKNKIQKMEKDSKFLLRIHRFVISNLIQIMGIRPYTEFKYKNRIGRGLNLDNPKGFNEKIQWLKLYYFQDFYRKSCDKYLVREYLKEKIGSDIEPPLIFACQKIEDFSLSKINYYPCIIKISNGSGQNLIINKEGEYSEDYIMDKLNHMIYEADNSARYSLEHQYLPKDAYIVVEKLMLDSKGKLPNDYKLMYINGKLEFIYCSVDRTGINVRHLYDCNWNRIDGILLENATEEKYKKYMATDSVPAPKSLEEMKAIGDVLSKDFPLVRLDFYDCDGKLYFGEVTLHHGGGFDRFYPESLDLEYGSKINLPSKNFELSFSNLLQ